MQFGAIGSYGFSVAVLLTAMMIAISGMVLGIGYALNDRRFKDFGSEGLYQSIISGVLVGSMMLLFANGGLVNRLVNSAIPANTSLHCPQLISGNSAICLSYNYLVGTQPYTFMGVSHASVFSMAMNITTGLLTLNAIVGMIASLKFSFIVSFSFGYVLMPILNELRYAIKLLIDVAVSAVVQAAVLVFVSAGALEVILPSGLVLRTFYPTRKIGGFLIALSIGMYAVFPMTYVLNSMLINTYSLSINSTSISQASVSASGTESSLISSAASYNALSTGILSSMNSIISQLSGALSGVMNGIIVSVSYLIVYAFVLPAFSLIITGISIRELASALGSEARFGRFDIL